MSSIKQTREQWIGTVAENAILGEEMKLPIFVNELFPNSSGKLEMNPEKITTSGVDALGKSYTISTKARSTIIAEWVNKDPNRITPPQLMKGERVSVFRYDNDPTYYWEPLNQDHNKRIQEVVVHAYAAKPADSNKKDVASTPQNCYTSTIDTVNGTMEWSCSEANKEKAPWVIQMDAKNGNFQISDRKGNVIQINNGGTTIDLINADKSHVQLSGQVINIYCADTTNIQAEKAINIKTKELRIEAENFYGEIGNIMDFNVGSACTIKSPVINLDGVVNVGSLNTGLGTGSGECSIKGPVSMQDSASIDGPVVMGNTLSVDGRVNFSAGGSSGPISGSGD